MVQLSEDKYTIPIIYESIKEATDNYVQKLINQESLTYGKVMKNKLFNIDEGYYYYCMIIIVITIIIYSLMFIRLDIC